MIVSNHRDEFTVASTKDSKLKLFVWTQNIWFKVVERTIDSMVNVYDWSSAVYTTIANRKTVSTGEVNSFGRKNKQYPCPVHSKQKSRP